MDLNGIWERPLEGSGTSGYHTQKTLIVQLRGEIEGVNLEGHPFVRPGQEWIIGSYDDKDHSIQIASKIPTKAGTLEWVHIALTMEDQDHLRMGADDVSYRRISKRDVHEMTCDKSNPLHISGDEAFARGSIYDVHLKDAATGTCWYYVAAAQGNLAGQEAYAMALRMGRGVAKDSGQAFSWFQKAAIQGGYYGAGNLSEMFSTGEGTFRSEQRAKYWRERAEKLDPHYFHNKDNQPIPEWAADTSGPCDASNPSHTDANQAFSKGRVAYEARALKIAGCWFNLSANQGNVKAKVYLGILFAFGLGVEKKPDLGFNYMTEAAKAGDYFAMMYLANFYRYGIGTKHDMNEASALVSRVMQTAAGQDVYMRVQGTYATGAQALGTLLGLVSAAADETTCTELRALDHDESHYYDCDAPGNEFFLRTLRTPAHHTIENPEEIFPESFFPIY